MCTVNTVNRPPPAERTKKSLYTVGFRSYWCIGKISFFFIDFYSSLSLTLSPPTLCSFFFKFEFTKQFWWDLLATWWDPFQDLAVNIVFTWNNNCSQADEKCIKWLTCILGALLLYLEWRQRPGTSTTEKINSGWYRIGSFFGKSFKKGKFYRRFHCFYRQCRHCYITLLHLKMIFSHLGFNRKEKGREAGVMNTMALNCEIMEQKKVSERIKMNYTLTNGQTLKTKYLPWNGIRSGFLRPSLLSSLVLQSTCPLSGL